LGVLNYRRMWAICGPVMLATLWGSLQPAPGDDDSALQKRRIADHWQTSPSKTLALVWSLDRKNPLLLSCVKGSGMDLTILQEKSSSGEKGHYLATIVFDQNTTITQTWLVTSKGAWATLDAYPDFANLLAMLKAHREVEFVLKRPGTDLIDSHFSLNGAGAAIDAVAGECRTP
jgi:hypothetical protein